MRVLVTGCCGFIGSHVCENLLNNNNEVFGIDNINDYYDVKVKEKNWSFHLACYAENNICKSERRKHRIRRSACIP